MKKRSVANTSNQRSAAFLDLFLLNKQTLSSSSSSFSLHLSGVCVSVCVVVQFMHGINKRDMKIKERKLLDGQDLFGHFVIIPPFS